MFAYSLEMKFTTDKVQKLTTCKTLKGGVSACLYNITRFQEVMNIFQVCVTVCEYTAAELNQMVNEYSLVSHFITVWHKHDSRSIHKM